jgi:hypothetical protein
MCIFLLLLLHSFFWTLPTVDCCASFFWGGGMVGAVILLCAALSTFCAVFRCVVVLFISYVPFCSWFCGVSLATLLSCVFVSWSWRQTCSEWVERENKNIVAIDGHYMDATPKNKIYNLYYLFLNVILMKNFIKWMFCNFIHLKVYIHQSSFSILSSLIYRNLCKLFYNKTWRQAG